MSLGSSSTAGLPVPSGDEFSQWQGNPNTDQLTLPMDQLFAGAGLKPTELTTLQTNIEVSQRVVKVPKKNKPSSWSCWGCMFSQNPLPNTVPDRVVPDNETENRKRNFCNTCVHGFCVPVDLLDCVHHPNGKAFSYKSPSGAPAIIRITGSKDQRPWGRCEAIGVEARQCYTFNTHQRNKSIKSANPAEYVPFSLVMWEPDDDGNPRRPPGFLDNPFIAGQVPSVWVKDNVVRFEFTTTSNQFEPVQWDIEGSVAPEHILTPENALAGEVNRSPKRQRPNPPETEAVVGAAQTATAQLEVVKTIVGEGGAKPEDPREATAAFPTDPLLTPAQQIQDHCARLREMTGVRRVAENPSAQQGSHPSREHLAALFEMVERALVYYAEGGIDPGPSATAAPPAPAAPTVSAEMDGGAYCAQTDDVTYRALGAGTDAAEGAYRSLGAASEMTVEMVKAEVSDTPIYRACAPEAAPLPGPPSRKQLVELLRVMQKGLVRGSQGDVTASFEGLIALGRELC